MNKYIIKNRIVIVKIQNFYKRFYNISELLIKNRVKQNCNYMNYKMNKHKLYYNMNNNQKNNVKEINKLKWLTLKYYKKNMQIYSVLLRYKTNY